MYLSILRDALGHVSLISELCWSNSGCSLRYNYLRRALGFLLYLGQYPLLPFQ